MEACGAWQMSRVGWGAPGQMSAARIRADDMGAKGSKGRSPGTVEALSPLAPLNNASYWEAEEDPEWDSCTMVVATQNDPLRADPFLHKEVAYPAINVSRRSSGEETGWHACFRNNNYVFVRNGHAACMHQQQQNDPKRNSAGKYHSLPKSPNDVTFVIKTTNPADGPQKGGTMVTLKKPRRRAPSPPMRRSLGGGAKGVISRRNTSNTLETQVKSTPPETADASSSKKSSSSSTKWLKRFRGSNLKKMMLNRSTPEERTPIYSSNPSSEEGPSTSTPIEDTDPSNRETTKSNCTPKRSNRLSVRRRLPYSDESHERTRLDLFDVSPLRAPPIACPNFTNDATFCERPELCDHLREGSQDDGSAEKAAEMTRSEDVHPKQSNQKHKAPDPPQNAGSSSRPLKDKSRLDKSEPCLALNSHKPLQKSSSSPSRINSDKVDRQKKTSPLPTRAFVRESKNRRSGVDRPISELGVSCTRESSSKRQPDVVCRTPNDSRLSVSEPALVTSPMEDEENESLMKGETSRSMSFESPQGSYLEEEGPVARWLRDIRCTTDSECLNALQAKQLADDNWTRDLNRVANSQEVCEKVWELRRSVAELLEQVLKVTSPAQRRLKAAKVCATVVDVMRWDAAGTHLKNLDGRSLEKSCAAFLEVANKDQGESCQAAADNLQEQVRITVDRILLHHLQVIVETLDESTNTNCLKRSLFALVLLGRLDPSLCKLMTKLGAVRSLLSVCVEPKWRSHHPCALRALTILCAAPQAIRSLDQNVGIDCLCDLLCDGTTEESTRSEAAGLVAQVTAPWTEGSEFVLPSIEKNADKLLGAITVLASGTESSEVFLLSCAALANLSFVDHVLKRMKDKNLLDTLVESCRNGAPHANSLFVKDQVATVLANMAAKEEFRKELSSGHSLVLLLCFLQLRPSVAHSAAQLSACERIQQKAAIAVARLCSDADTSNVVADMRGIQRLVKLCKDRKERNNSDSVLVACLAALRKIAAVRQKEEFQKLGAQELVEPRLWDAFLAHSSKQESYV